MHSVVHAAGGESGYQTFTLHAGEWGWLIFSAAVALLALAVGFILMRGVLAADEGTPDHEGDRARRSRRGRWPTSGASSARSPSSSCRSRRSCSRRAPRC